MLPSPLGIYRRQVSEAGHIGVLVPVDGTSTVWFCVRPIAHAHHQFARDGAAQGNDGRPVDGMLEQPSSAFKVALREEEPSIKVVSLVNLGAIQQLPNLEGGVNRDGEPRNEMLAKNFLASHANQGPERVAVLVQLRLIMHNGV